MTESPKFLRSVADYVLSHNDDLSSLTLVFPNKRSAMFLKKYMQERLVETSARPRFMPRFVTMDNVVSRFSPRPVMGRTEQLFLLYDCYRRLLTDMGRDEQLRDFDKFIFWGGMILDDFDDIDRQLVDASKLFKNLRDLKEINADYLDEEQKQIVRQLWGETARTAAVTEFWTHVNNVEGDSPEARFVALWQLLGELYTLFISQLHDRGFDTAGQHYRQAAAAMANLDFETGSARRYAFVGFNDLTNSEAVIFKRLKDIGAAEFFWDFDSALLRLAFADSLGAKFDRLKKTFPMPDDFDPAAATDMPQIEVLAVPSEIGQAKVVADILDGLDADETITEENAIETAIVLPDENLLTPLLLSIPESVPAVNITMGVPFSTSAFASMLHSVISMQIRAREIRGVIHYYYADVSELLSHPHIQVIAPEAAESIKKYIAKNNLFNIPADEICSRYPELTYLFSPVKAANDPAQICDYMSSLIDGLSEALKNAVSTGRDTLPEIEMLDYFRDGSEELRRLISDYDITMTESTYFGLFERLMQTRRIDLQGTPLRGLQVMGVLETRALDFENVIILSVNENSFPRKNYLRTMIPNNLRIGYGMTTIDSRDAVYAYYFYRLISRAKRVTLVYDSRQGNFGAGEKSRYVGQLLHITPPGTVTERTVRYATDYNTPPEITVTKDADVMKRLSRFLPGGNASLSATALKEYKKCRLRFYLRYVCNLRGDDEVTDYITAANYGTIVHRVAEVLFGPYENKLVTADIIGGMLERSDEINEIIARTIFDIFYRNTRYTSADNMPAEGVMTCSIINFYIRKMLETERRMAERLPFTYIKGEMQVKSPPAWQLTDSLSVNFKMSIDRVDRLAENYYRFIDYKTGSDKAAPTTLEKIFTRGRSDDDAVFQLLTYAMAYRDMTGEDCGVMPSVYPLRIIASKEEIPQIEIDKEVITDCRTIEPEFRTRFTEMVSEIFSPDVPFDQAEDNRSCKFCPFLDLCGRTEPSF